MHFWARQQSLSCCVHVQLLLPFGPYANEILYPLNSLCKKWKYDDVNYMFFKCSSNSAAVKHEGNMLLTVALLLGCKTNYKLCGELGFQRSTHSTVVTLHPCPNMF